MKRKKKINRTGGNGRSDRTKHGQRKIVKTEQYGKKLKKRRRETKRDRKDGKEREENKKRGEKRRNETRKKKQTEK